MLMAECPSYTKCGACSLLRTDYSEQLKIKRESVEQAFRSKGLTVKVHDVAGMDCPFHYRNKVIAYVGVKGGKTSVGLYEENSHKVVPTPDCLLQNGTLNEILRSIREELDRLKIRPYGYGGVLKNILLRIGVNTSQVLVVFVTSEDMFHGSRDLVKRLVSRHPCIRTVIQNVNSRDTSVVLGEREKTLYAPGFITDVLMGNSFKISAASFYQINPLQTAVLYSKALELAAIRPGETVMDAYCGIGTIGITAASSAGNVTGVEINADAVRDAISNARHNNIRNVRFYCEDVKRFMRDEVGGTDVLILDPPRSGCDREFLEAVKRLRPGRIVYVSCNPQTQASDVAFLSSMYSAGDAWPVDMFPHTSHIENVMLLVRR